MPPTGPNTRLHVAIIGGGITGLSLAAGLKARGVRFTVYEQSPSFREVGAGVGLSPNAERALGRLSAGALAAFNAVAMPNGEDYFQWVDGHGSDKVVYRLWIGEGLFRGCLRSDFVEELGRLVGTDCVSFGKDARSIAEEDDGSVTITFGDGSTARADVVIGCDGIHSRTRQLLLGEANPASHPGYTNRSCFRALIPMAAARAAIGDHRTSTRFMYNGPGAHIITYPVGHGASLNVLAVASDPHPWPDAARHTKPATAADAAAAFADWHPTARAIVGLLPDRLDRWAVFDSFAGPAPSYVRGAVGLAGDAAHAAGPHLGSGAGFGIEDALVLAALLEAVDEVGRRGGRGDVGVLCRDALEVYNSVRYERTQWLVGATREACSLFHWEDPECGSDPDKFGREITWRFHKIWHYDVDAMVREALDQLAKRRGEMPN